MRKILSVVLYPFTAAGKALYVGLGVIAPLIAIPACLWWVYATGAACFTPAMLYGALVHGTTDVAAFPAISKTVWVVVSLAFLLINAGFVFTFFERPDSPTEDKGVCAFMLLLHLAVVSTVTICSMVFLQ